jgi:glycosyltransferase involved in cell wall biosynthesis
MRDRDRLVAAEAMEACQLAVVVPAYRVGGKIGQVVRNMPPFVQHIIVVDDCSPDDVYAEIQPWLGERVHLVRHKINQGVGGAMLSGYAFALQLRADIVVKMDGDDQMDPAQLPRLVMPIIAGEADYTKGNRFLHTHALHQMPLARRVGNFGLTFLTKLASGYWNVFDPNNGFTAIHREVLSLLNTERISRRYFFESSMLIELRRVQAVVYDVPIPARYGDEVSTLSLKRTLVSFPVNLLKGTLQRLGWQYFLYDFTAVSLLLVLGLLMLLAGAAWGAYHWYISIVFGIVATTGTVLLAVLPIILGFQFLVQALVLDIGSVPRTAVHTRAIESADLLTHASALTDYLDRSPSPLEIVQI